MGNIAKKLNNIKMYTSFCKKNKCPHYVEWDTGEGFCYSCKLQGESYSIDKLAPDCPYKDQYIKKKISSI